MNKNDIINAKIEKHIQGKYVDWWTMHDICHHGFYLEYGKNGKTYRKFLKFNKKEKAIMSVLKEEK